MRLAGNVGVWSLPPEDRRALVLRMARADRITEVTLPSGRKVKITPLIRDGHTMRRSPW